MKKFFALTMTLLITVYSVSFCAGAAIYYKDGKVFHMPGHMRKYTELKDYNYAWADEIVIRDGSSSVLPLTMHPIAEYPYSHTLEEYVKECNDYTSLFYVSDKVLENTFNDIIESYYYLLVASGKIPDNLPDIKAFNESQGIVYPNWESKYTNFYSAFVYACLKTDFYSAIAEEPIHIVRGTTLEGAVVALLGGICSYEVPSSVDTIEGFCLLFARDNVIEDKNIPISSSPDEDEVLYWIKLLGAEKGGYAVNKTKPFSAVSQEEYDYVTYAYYASILTGKYEIPISPMLLKEAVNSTDENAIAELVLKSMLDNVSVAYKTNESMPSLFDKALKEGYFDLEDEFYSDIYDYTITVDEAFDSIWITEFLLAEDLGGEKSGVSVYVNGSKVENVLSYKVPLNSEGLDDKVTVEIIYKDDFKSEKAVYTFNVKRSNTGSENPAGMPIDFLDPQGIYQSVEELLQNKKLKDAAEENTQPYSFPYYPEHNNTDSFKFETYPTDANGNIISNENPLSLQNTQTNSVHNVNIERKESVNKATMAASSTSFVLAGGVLGFLIYNRKKNVSEDENSD